MLDETFNFVMYLVEICCECAKLLNETFDFLCILVKFAVKGICDDR